MRQRQITARSIVQRIDPAATAGYACMAVRDITDDIQNSELLVGVEIAGSPLATINVLGPRVVASDFGNNAGLILGRVVRDWRERPDRIPPCAAYVDGKLVGEGALDFAQTNRGKVAGGVALGLVAVTAWAFRDQIADAIVGGLDSAEPDAAPDISTTDTP